MVSRVLVPIEDSEMAERALRYALEAHQEAEITVLHVVGKPSPMMGDAAGIALTDDIETAAEERAESIFDRAREIAAEYGTSIDTEVAMGKPARVIVKRADDFDTIVMGIHGGDFVSRLFVGNTAEMVFRHSPVPVTVVR